MKRLLLSLFVAVSLTAAVWALPKEDTQDKILTNPTNVFDLQNSTVSNVEFYSTNYGIFGLNIRENKGGGIWPRGSQNQYIFGGGFWFGAQKFVKDSNKLKKLVEISYNPNNGRSWFVPGLASDCDTMETGDNQKYKCYFSTDFDNINGTDLNNQTNPNWPLWINDSLYRYEYGTIRNEFVGDQSKRNRTENPLGPLFVSNEDIVSVFKDSDLRFYDGGMVLRKAQGYPLGLKYESRIYTWGTGDMKDVVLVSYLAKNISQDTLNNCWFAPVSDVDIARKPNDQAGAGNDRFSYFTDDSSQNLAYGWTNGDQGEAGKGFGYIGLSFLESPAVDGNGFIRNDKFIYEQSEQLGLKTFRNWAIVEDKFDDYGRYDFISSQRKDGDTGPADNRMMISTGPFNMKPGDVARVVIAFVFAMPAKGGEADGTYEDLTGLKRITDKKGGNGLLATNSSLIGKLNQAKTNYYSDLKSGVKTTENSVVNTLSISPNPASNSANLKFNLNDAGLTKISVVNQFGQEINVIYNSWLEGGEHNINLSFEKNTYSDGIYFIRLTSGNSTQTKKFAIVR